MTEFVSAVPIIPARDIEASAAWYHDELGFEVFHAEEQYGIVGRDESWIHFWGPSGIPPKGERVGARLKPGTNAVSIRLGVQGIDELYEHCQKRDLVHPNSPLEGQPWGFREFAVIDHDGNLVTFVEPPQEYDPREESS